MLRLPRAFAQNVASCQFGDLMRVLDKLRRGVRIHQNKPLATPARDFRRNSSLILQAYPGGYPIFWLGCSI